MKQQTQADKPAVIPPSSSSKKASSSSKFERTRMKLVNAVREEIQDSGDFSADQVARRSKTSPANFYNHFATKDAALLAAYDQMMAELVTLVSDQCQIERLLDEGMQPFMAGWVLQTAGFFAANSALLRLAQAAFGRSKSLRNIFRTHEVIVIETYRRFIELGQAAQLIRQGDQVTMAQMLAVFTESWHHSLVQKLTPDDALHNELTQALVRILSPDNESL